MPEPQNLRASGERIEQALNELQATADRRSLELAEELLRLVSDLYGAGLARMAEIARARSPELVAEFAADELVASLLLVQGLHPDPLDVRVEGALESVRPFLGRHGGDVELLAVDDDLGAVKLRLLGNCDGCPSSAATLQGAVEAAILEAAPEVTRIVVEEPSADATPAVPIALGVKPRVRRVPDRGGDAMTDPLAVLQRIRAGTPPREPARVEEVCELCSEPIATEHPHLVDLRSSTLLCACRGCFLLFESQGAGGDHFRSVPERYLAFDDFELTPAQWDSLQIPVSVAFFFLNSELQRIAAFYPGPAGATESELPLDTWADVVGANPQLATMQPDVEAFLVRAASDRGDRPPECYIVPIDACYELVGHLRMLWRGFDGGSEANRKLDDFFADIGARGQ